MKVFPTFLRSLFDIVGFWFGVGAWAEKNPQTAKSIRSFSSLTLIIAGLIGVSTSYFFPVPVLNVAQALGSLGMLIAGIMLAATIRFGKP